MTGFQAQDMSVQPPPERFITACDHRTIAVGDLTSALPELRSAANHAEAASDTVAAHKIRAAVLLVTEAAEQIAAKAREHCL